MGHLFLFYHRGGKPLQDSRWRSIPCVSANLPLLAGEGNFGGLFPFHSREPDFRTDASFYLISCRPFQAQTPSPPAGEIREDGDGNEKCRSSEVLSPPSLPRRGEGKGKPQNPTFKRESLRYGKSPPRFLKNGLNENDLNGTPHFRIPAMRGKR
jgi:hypothetical protein